MRRLVIVFAAISSLFVACDKDEVYSPTGTYVQGNFEGIQGGELILVQSLMTDRVETIDTIIPDVDGNFQVGLNVPEIGFYRIYLNNNNVAGLILQPNDTVQFTANIENLPSTYAVSGSIESEKLHEFDNIMNTYIDKIDSLNALVGRAKANEYYNEMAALMSEQDYLQRNTGDKIRQFVKDNDTYLASLSAVQKLDPEGDFELFVQVMNGLEPKLGGTDLHNDLKSRIDMWRKAQIGGKMMDITLRNPEGESITLYDQLGELTLVDFWASWCRPCRAENPNIVKAYDKYKSKGFTVVGISLDEDEIRWKEAIEQDGLGWTHMSDLKLWNSAAVQTYNIGSIPASFIVDKEGIIVAKNLRGAALDLKISQLLGE